MYQIKLKSFKFLSKKFCGLKMMDMFVDTWIRGFSILETKTVIF